jgi:cellulose synthase/poly-beta-1,6-N-acetylglucosamine synthase-like glycosyltransferase
MVTIFVSTYILTIFTDFFKTIVEVLVNLLNKPMQPRYLLNPSEVAFVIPCHNSADTIEETIRSIPHNYPIICVANACSDETIAKINRISEKERLSLFCYRLEKPGKMTAVLEGILGARDMNHTHFVLLDDDVRWPKDRLPTVSDRLIPATALPVMPTQPRSWIELGQMIEYLYMVVSKRAQGILGNTIMASGAAGIYRIDSFLEVLKKHDGEHIGDDLQSAHLHHALGYRIDFNPSLVVHTHPPKTIIGWWKQRARRWEISPVYNANLIFKTIFSPKTNGWWIRWVALYRVFVFGNDIARLYSLPYVIYHFPRTLVGVWAIAYLCMMFKALVYYSTYKDFRYTVNGSVILGILTYPVYTSMMWVSRLWAVPGGVIRNFKRKQGGIYA